MFTKRNILLIVTFVIFVFTPIASAEISEEDVVLGGLVPRTDLSNAFAIYGNPDRAENQRYYWGDGFKVITNNRNMMTMIITTADNGIATPTGLHVGSTVSEMYMIYGRPDETNLEINGNGYVYFYDGGPVCFHIKAENDTIKEISASRYIK